MIKFDFETYVDKNILEEYKELVSRKEEVIEKFNNSRMIGWSKHIGKNNIDKINNTANYIKNNFDCLVVVGVGGSYLGSYAFSQTFKKYFKPHPFEVIYVGTTLSSKFLNDLLVELENKNYCINVISKTGKTMETKMIYNFLKDDLKKRYGEDKVKDHVVITTSDDGNELDNEPCIERFDIPQNIAGRYSFLTAAHLLPLATNFDIYEIVDGYYEGSNLIDEAFNYAGIRYLLFKHNKVVENYCIHEEHMLPFTEWLKQLFAETEGKDGKGILPMSTLYTRDLHSLGQFIQQGNKILFETFIRFKNSEIINYKSLDINSINNMVLDSVINAHSKGDTNILEITMDELSVRELSTLIYFFMLSAAFSGYLFEVNPFNHPGVDVYKEEVKNILEEIITF
ncbi:MAG: hypothetical protein IKG58_00890 [Bacilli bacterium]|nr:hypothetical protein [Bacilli bacterium]